MTIESFMTKAPHTIGADQLAVKAHDYMREHSIRHVPVLRGGEVVGIVSDRDLQFLFAFTDVKPEEVTVEELMSTEVYTIPTSTPVKEVVSHMAEHKIGSAVILDGKDVAGIFTTVDALKALAKHV